MDKQDMIWTSWFRALGCNWDKCGIGQMFAAIYLYIYIQGESEWEWENIEREYYIRYESESMLKSKSF